MINPNMKKLLRILVWSIVCLLAIGSVALTAIYVVSAFRLDRRYLVTVAPAPVSTDAGAIERGRHIALTRGCLHCHGDDLGGATVLDNALIGKLSGPNLTRGRGGLPPEFMNQDWVRAIRHGVRPDGRPLVLMPSAEFATLSKNDFADLLAFLGAAPRVDRATVPIRLGPLGRILLITNKFPLAADLIDHGRVQANEEPRAVTAAYGRYLAVACIGCHGPNFSGGKIAAGPPDWPPAANLTTIADGPLAHWTEADFIATLRTGRTPNGQELNPAMPRTFGHLTDEELQAIWKYLRTLPPAITGQRMGTTMPN